MSPGALTASTRHAALVAHAMQPDDRHWLLQALAPDERALLDGLLVELQALGIPADASLLHEFTAARPPSTPQQRLQQLTACQLATLEDILRDEPGPLAAVLLSLGPWPWQLGAGRRADPPSDRPGAALAKALCEALVREIDARGPRPLAPVPTRGRWRRIFRRGQP